MWRVMIGMHRVVNVMHRAMDAIRRVMRVVHRVMNVIHRVLHGISRVMNASDYVRFGLKSAFSHCNRRLGFLALSRALAIPNLGVGLGGWLRSSWSKASCLRAAAASGLLFVALLLYRIATMEFSMSRSFYYGTDAQLLSSSNSFSALITANPTSYGLVAGQATAYGTLNTAFGTALALWLAPATRTKVTLENKNAAREALIANAKMLAAIIQSTPTVTNGQRAALGLSIRETPTPVGSLGKPTKLKVTLSETGALELGWSCSSPRASGMTYQIYRRNAPDGEFTYIGGSGEKKFTDATLPAGSSQVTYQIQAVRSTAVGPWASFNVNFGVSSGNGAAKTSVTEAKPVKIAA
jgi:hypothetical protein